MINVSSRVQAHPITGKEQYKIAKGNDGQWSWDDGYGDGGPLSIARAPIFSGERVLLDMHLRAMQDAITQAGISGVNLMMGPGCGYGTLRFAVEAKVQPPVFLGTVVKHARTVPISQNVNGAVIHEDRELTAKEIVAAVRSLLLTRNSG